MDDQTKDIEPRWEKSWPRLSLPVGLTGDSRFQKLANALTIKHSHAVGIVLSIACATGADGSRRLLDRPNRFMALGALEDLGVHPDVLLGALFVSGWVEQHGNDFYLVDDFIPVEKIPKPPRKKREKPLPANVVELKKKA